MNGCIVFMKTSMISAKKLVNKSPEILGFLLNECPHVVV
jgi:hypothetical protein